MAAGALRRAHAARTRSPDKEAGLAAIFQLVYEMMDEEEDEDNGNAVVFVWAQSALMARY